MSLFRVDSITKVFKISFLWLVLLTCILALVAWSVPIQDIYDNFASIIHMKGNFFIVFIITTLLTVAAFPVVASSMFCGFVFYGFYGWFVSLLGTVLGSIVLFYFGQAHRSRMGDNSPFLESKEFRAVEVAIKGKSGLKVVGLMRISPALSSFITYCLGLCRMPLVLFLLSSLVGWAPLCLCGAFVGAGGRMSAVDTGRDREGGAALFLGLLLVGAVCITPLVTKALKKALFLQTVDNMERQMRYIKYEMDEVNQERDGLMAGVDAEDEVSTPI